MLEQHSCVIQGTVYMVVTAYISQVESINVLWAHSAILYKVFGDSLI